MTHTHPELCEVRGCCQPAYTRSTMRNHKDRQKWICLYHAEAEQSNSFVARFKGVTGSNVDRDYEDYNRARFGALGRLIYDRELSFSEKVAQLDFLDR